MTYFFLSLPPSKLSHILYFLTLFQICGLFSFSLTVVTIFFLITNVILLEKGSRHWYLIWKMKGYLVLERKHPWFPCSWGVWLSFHFIIMPVLETAEHHFSWNKHCSDGGMPTCTLKPSEARSRRRHHRVVLPFQHSCSHFQCLWNPIKNFWAAVSTLVPMALLVTLSV